MRKTREQTLSLEGLVSNTVVDAPRVVLVHHGFQVCNREGGSESSEAVSDGGPMAV